MSNVLLAGLGGFLGAMGRYGLSGIAQRWAGSPWFPVGTLVVNALGCLLIGLLAGFAEVRGGLAPARQALLLAGVLGGFTTFSSFGFETVQLLRDGLPGHAAFNVLLQLGLGLGTVAAGIALGRHL